MYGKAIYVGKRHYKREQRVDENGVVIPEFKGMQYLYYTSDWHGDEIDGMGRTRFDIVEDKDNKIKEYEERLPEIGGFCQVQIKEAWGNQPNNSCKFVKAE